MRKHSDEDPVAIPCGHSYCMNCIKTHWDGEDEKKIHSCPQCRKIFIPRPVLVKNTMLAVLVEELKKTGLHAAPADHCYAGPEDVACDVCTGRKLKAVKSCLQCLISYCENTSSLQPHLESPAFEKHKLVDPSKKLQENICSRHDEVMKIFCRTDQKCICYLCSVDEHKDHDTVSAAAERTERQRELEVSRQNIQQRIQDREKDVKELQQEVEAINRSADKAVEDSEKIFSQLIRLIQKRSSDVKQQLRSQQETEVSRVKELQEKLEQEITELKRKDADLKQLSHTEDHTQYFEDVTQRLCQEVRDKLQDVLTDREVDKHLTDSPQSSRVGVYLDHRAVISTVFSSVRHYFVSSPYLAFNSGEQFYMLTIIAAWLINAAGRPFAEPQEYDEPNATVSNILAELRAFGVKVDFPPSKLKSGSGEHVCFVLDRLAEEALRRRGFSFKRPNYPTETTEEESVMEDDAELTLSKVEEKMIDEPDNEEETVMDLEALKLRTTHTEAEPSSKPDEILESTVDAAEWNLELERVLPQLKVTIRTDNNDWRIHVDQMHQHRDGIKSSLREAKSYLDKLQEDIGKTLEKVSSREKYINNQLEHLIQEYRSAQAKLSQAKERYQQASGGVTERTRVLAEVSEHIVHFTSLCSPVHVDKDLHFSNVQQSHPSSR
ncbi:hypothetical protein L3Q82_005993 [Scortum barcoo]|uniref:Uncharacterized protein n=1 Tax=Scortum barcoo TaxID=214431 RepID=A0ACB8X1K0_9TELE|nr:hypothetical protein L3Q82_005993 [Scortum barcoo]